MWKEAFAVGRERIVPSENPTNCVRTDRLRDLVAGIARADQTGRAAERITLSKRVIVMMRR